VRNPTGFSELSLASLIMLKMKFFFGASLTEEEREFFPKV
jgi:hypothetical protein